MGFQVENLPEAIRGPVKMLRLSLILFCATPFGISQTPPSGSVPVDLANSSAAVFLGQLLYLSQFAGKNGGAGPVGDGQPHSYPR